MSYASSDAFFFQGTLGDNLLYGLKHAPLQPPGAERGRSGKARNGMIDEARQSGNPDFDIRSDWIDYEAAGATGPHDLIDGDPAGARRDDPVAGHHRPGAALVRRARAASRSWSAASSSCARRCATGSRRKASAAWSCRSSPDTYNPEATIGENLRFGTAKGPALADKALASNPYVMSVLKEVGLDETLYDMGLEIASNAIELFADLPPDNPLFQQLTFMTPEEIPDYQALLQRLQGTHIRRRLGRRTAPRSSR